MNFFEWKKPNIFKKGEESKEHTSGIEQSVSQELPQNEGEDEFGPGRTPEEKNNDRQLLADLVKKYKESRNEEEKEWTKQEIEKLQEEINERLDSTEGK